MTFMALSPKGWQTILLTIVGEFIISLVLNFPPQGTGHLPKQEDLGRSSHTGPVSIRDFTRHLTLFFLINMRTYLNHE